MTTEPRNQLTNGRGARIPRRPDAAGRAALTAYAEHSAAVRLHARVRWYSAPFPAIAGVLPNTGRILEIGCGHGLFSVYAALASSARAVRGVDIDRDKIAVAQAVAARVAADLEFDVTPSGAVSPGPWDAIVVVDMLYLLPAAQQEQLLTEAAGELAPGGRLVIKEMSRRPRWKAAWNTAQETLAVSILGITERASTPAEPRPAAGRRRFTPARFEFVAPETMAGWLAEAGLATSSRRLDRGRIHPHHLLVGHRAG
jgi:2-polyprenyl-3-methyl-5-hydroxy-6-metoxy-1,4-benzoquinol methylase